MSPVNHSSFNQIDVDLPNAILVGIYIAGFYLTSHDIRLQSIGSGQVSKFPSRKWLRTPKKPVKTNVPAKDPIQENHWIEYPKVDCLIFRLSIWDFIRQHCSACSRFADPFR
jgi:hypothetical protein